MVGVPLAGTLGGIGRLNLTPIGCPLRVPWRRAGWRGVPALQLARCSPTAPYRRRIVRRGDADDIADAHLHLQVTRARTMIMREEHQHMMRNHIGLIQIA